MNAEDIRRRGHVLIIGACVILLTVTISGCIQTSESKGWAKETFYGDYATDDNTVLIVENVNGDIDITGWSGDRITLDAEEKVEDKYEEQLDDVEINVTLDSNKVIIKAIYTTEKRDVEVTMTIKVPHAVTLESVKNTNGEIKIFDVKGDCVVTNTNGLINIDDVDGYINAKMTNGDIEIKDTMGIQNVENINGNIKTEIFNLRANVDIINTNGDVAVYILPTMNANLTLKTENGRVEVHSLTLEYSVDDSKLKTGELGLGTYMVNLITTNGNVDLFKLS
jgi:hypothetical protein